MTDDTYEMRREDLLREAEERVSKRKLNRPYSAELLDELDRMYDTQFRPNQAEERARIKEEIRAMTRKRKKPGFGLPKAFIH